MKAPVHPLEEGHPRPSGDRAGATRTLLNQVFERVTDAFVALDKDWHYTYVNARAGEMFGRRPEDLVGKHIWTEFPEGVGQPFHRAYERAMASQESFSFEEYYPPYDRWFENILYPSADGLSIYFHDITERKLAALLVESQKLVFEMVADDAPLEATLDALLLSLERQSPDMLCSILVLGVKGLHMRHEAAPSLPAAYIRAIDGQAIGPCVGSCGTAMFRREAVVVEDIASDPLWVDYRDIALAHGLRACWSMPIFDAVGGVLGSFAIYHRQPRRPDAKHLRLIEVATHAAAVAISRKQDKAALRENEAQLRQLGDNLSGGMIYQVVREHDGRMRYQYVSAGIVEVNGLTPEAVLADPMALYSQLHSEDAPRVAAAEAESLRTMTVFNVEVRLRRADGEWRWMQLTSTPRQLPDGRVLWDGIELDITERKRAEAGQHESHERLRLALDAAHMGIFDWDIPQDRIVWSRWHEEMWGFKPGQFGGTYAAFSQRVHPDDLPAIDASISRCIADREPFVHEFRVVWPDGSLHWVQSHGELTFGDDGAPLRMHGAVIETTARRQAEMTLAASEGRLRSIIDNEPECVKLVAADGSLLEMNPAGLRMLEIDSFQDVKDQCIYPLVAEEHRQAFIDLNESVFAGGSGTLEFQVVGLKGGHRWLDTHASPLRDASGKVIALLGITRDITERRAAQLQLLESEQRLRQILDGLGPHTFVGLMDPNGVLLIANKSARDVAALEDSDFVGQLIEESYWFSYSEAARLRVREATRRAAAGESVRVDEQIRVADGNLMWIDFSIEPLRDESGTVTALVPSAIAIEQRKHAEQELRDAIAQQHRLARRLVEVREAEQRLLSVELHDRIGQNLTALSINLNIIGSSASQRDAAATAARLKDSRELLENTIASVRDLITELRPAALEEYGLLAGLRSLAYRVQERSGVLVSVSGGELLPRLAPQVEAALFRIAQEALTNIVKHAQARAVVLALGREAAITTLSISDDGNGFEPVVGQRPDAQQGWGLEMMRERAQGVGAELQVQSAPGSGTRIEVSVVQGP